MAALFGGDLSWKQWRIRTNSCYQTVKNDFREKGTAMSSRFPAWLGE